MVEHDYERERRKMNQVEESKLFNKTWYHIADGDPAAQADAQTAPDAHHSTHDRT